VATVGGVARPDLVLTPSELPINAIVRSGEPLPWSGFNLSYENSETVNQGGAVNVKVVYTLTEFQEIVVPDGPPLGTAVTVIDPVTGDQHLSIHIAKLSSTTWDGKPLIHTILPGDILQVMSYHGAVVYTDLATADANGVVRYEGAPTVAQVGAGSQSLQLAINSNGVTILGSGPGTMLRFTAK
jgi:hypothetical protein